MPKKTNKMISRKGRRRGRRKRVKRVLMMKKGGSMSTLSISRIGPAGMHYILLHRMGVLRYVRFSLMLRLISTLETPSRW